ncbi:hypothetical protein GOP47_0024421 [Adiantum capillus-veneris]|uniref:Uncharacterized protein n=1 Tax=Adiantum capillus-veneris TaxID=13818 RepID=A0A9D4U4G8_ADICA|nr:hypothetical protein GOP47_0024421 [Adiantum capillus-veneris]
MDLLNKSAKVGSTENAKIGFDRGGGLQDLGSKEDGIDNFQRIYSVSKSAKDGFTQNFGLDRNEFDRFGFERGSEVSKIKGFRWRDV